MKRHLIRKELSGASFFDRKMRWFSPLTENELSSVLFGAGHIPTKYTDKEFYIGGERNFDFIAPPVLFSDPEADACVISPNRLYLELTRACNLKCRMCYNASGRPLPGELSTNQWFSVLDRMAEIGVFEARFTGGEAVLKAGFFQILEHALDLGFYASLATNGVWNEGLRRKVLDYPIDDLIVSLDGPERINDAMRLGGSFQETLRTIRLAKEAGVPKVRINTVLSRENWREVESLFQVARDYDLLLIDFIHPRPFGRGQTDDAKAITLTAEEMLEFNRLAAELREKYPTVKIVMDFDLFATREIPKHPIVPRIHACPAGREFAFVNPQGYVFPCSVAPVDDVNLMTDKEREMFLAGNVLEQDILSIWQTSPVWRPFRNLRKCKPPKCFSCSAWGKKCFGTCPFGAYYESGDLAGEDPYCYSHLI
jgi:radical SAM protein with 4Fe4S-binding SPASM domain